MYLIKEPDQSKVITRTDYNSVKSCMTYQPIIDVIVIKCGFDYDISAEVLCDIVNELNQRDIPLSQFTETFLTVSVKNHNISLCCYPRTSYIKNLNMFPIAEKGRKYIVLTYVCQGDDVEIYQPNYAQLNAGGVGSCTAPLNISYRVSQSRQQKLGFFKRGVTDERTIVTFEYSTCEGYVDGDIFYTVEGVKTTDSSLTTFPITKKALEANEIQINCNSSLISFDSKKTIKFVKEA